MKTILVALLSLSLLAVAGNVVFAADPVDLTGKTGVVDPNDLKKYDPKPAKPEGATPPPSNSDSKPFSGKGSYGQAK